MQPGPDTTREETEPPGDAAQAPDPLRPARPLVRLLRLLAVAAGIGVMVSTYEFSLWSKDLGYVAGLVVSLPALAPRMARFLGAVGVITSVLAVCVGLLAWGIGWADAGEILGWDSVSRVAGELAGGVLLWWMGTRWALAAHINLEPRCPVS